MKALIQTLVFLSVIFLGCQPIEGKDRNLVQEMSEDTSKVSSAVFAGGCFWCTESDFEKVDGVVGAISGYMGGHVANPTYKQVSRGGTGHVEAVKVIYDPAKVSYGKLLEVFWRHVDPTDAGGQFVDRGQQYRSAIFYGSDRERDLAESSKRAVAASGFFDKPIVTDILPSGIFYPAETYHQDYYKRNRIRYRYYRSGSGRDQYLRKQWTDSRSMGFSHRMWAETPGGQGMAPSLDPEASKRDIAAGEDPWGFRNSGGNYVHPAREELRRRLTPLQYKITQEEGTEPSYRNAFWDHHGVGIYVDIVSGEPLFSSLDKYDSRTGWPSFTRPLVPDNVVERVDRGLFMTRTEVRSRHADSHLGHLFKDGPAPTGLRYCINSAALRFVSKADLEEQGYEAYRHLFE